MVAVVDEVTEDVAQRVRKPKPVSYLSRDELVKPHLDEKDITVQGQKVRVRQLSWAEFREVSKAMGSGEATGVAVDALLISLSFVQPSLTQEDAHAWIINGPANELNEVVGELLEYSGFTVRKRDEGASFPG